eukprot:350803-Chlamydomonas_euryale.AAC.5
MQRQVTDVSPLATCHRLRALDLRRCNGVADMSPLAECHQLVVQRNVALHISSCCGGRLEGGCRCSRPENNGCCGGGDATYDGRIPGGCCGDGTNGGAASGSGRSCSSIGGGSGGAATVAGTGSARTCGSCRCRSEGVQGGKGRRGGI